MAFKIITPKGPQPKIEWKFETLDRTFVSNSDAFKRNIAFWQDKLNIAKDVKVEILNGVEHLYEQLEEDKNVIDVEHTEVTDLPKDATTDISETLKSRLEENEHTIDAEPAIESRVDEPTEQPSVSQDTESTNDTPKRKSRKKAI